MWMHDSVRKFQFLINKEQDIQK
uniref:Uncharacterized protein n=1 Tax=Nelumbo nucifera TaxID=4432 RepID=A0A822ZAW3_NELNU|nr:TPA_asm: hypothetical protein HUJ06_014912 [Nelumbo nucifera]